VSRGRTNAVTSGQGAFAPRSDWGAFSSGPHLAGSRTHVSRRTTDTPGRGSAGWGSWRPIGGSGPLTGRTDVLTKRTDVLTGRTDTLAGPTDALTERTDAFAGRTRTFAGLTGTRADWTWKRSGASRRSRTQTKAGGGSMTTRGANPEAIIAGRSQFPRDNYP
jgi:hypothetical protein